MLSEDDLSFLHQLRSAEAFHVLACESVIPSEHATPNQSVLLQPDVQEYMAVLHRKLSSSCKLRAQLPPSYHSLTYLECLVSEGTREELLSVATRNDFLAKMR